MSLWDLAFYVIIAAIVFVLVRPKAPTTAAVIALTDLAAGLVGATTGSLFTKGG